MPGHRLLPLAAALLVCGATATAAPAATTRTKTLKVTGGSTALTLAPAAVANLQAAGVTMTGTAPGTTAGTLLTYPITSGSLKVKGSKVVGGRLVHGGGLTMASSAANLSVGSLTVTLAKPPMLLAKLQTVSVPLATLTVPSSGVKVGKTSVKFTKVVAKLTSVAANSMNNTFGVTTFKAGDPIGSATITAKVTR